MNKDYAESGLKLGLGTGSKKQSKTPGQTSPASDSLPMGSPSWPGVPGKTQPRSRSAGTPTTGKLGPFETKKVGL